MCESEFRNHLNGFAKYHVTRNPNLKVGENERLSHTARMRGVSHGRNHVKMCDGGNLSTYL